MAGLPLFRTLTSRVMTLMMATIIIMSTVLGASVYYSVTVWQAEAALESLLALAAARQAAIEGQVNRYLDVGAAFVAPDLGYEIEQLQAAEGAEAEILREALRLSMRRKLRAIELLDQAQIVDPENRVIIQTEPGLEPFLGAGSLLLRESLLRSALSAPQYNDGGFYVDIAVPLTNSRGNTIAVLVLRKSAYHLLSITGDYAGLGETGETVLGERRGDEIRFLVPLRFAPDPSAMRSVLIGEGLAVPMIRATAGQAGVTRSVDYRGVPVIAAFRPIAGTEWGVVAKQDEAEIFAAARNLRTSLSLLVLGLVFFSAAVGIPVLLKFTRPLRRLGEAMEQVVEGDLDVQVQVPTDEEIGTVTNGFNVMIQRVRDSRADLQRRNAELDSFARVVSHDLKAPLRGVANLAQWLGEDLGERLDEENRANLNLIQERVGRMNALIDALLDFARAGQAGGRPINVDIERLVATVVADLGPLDGVSVKTVASLPVVFGSETLLRQVFQNLIDNAVKHHPGPTGSVEISCTDAQGLWEFSVRDDGAGIEPRYHQKIFEIFESLREQPDVESTGVGLAVTKKIVENVGGTIWVQSEGVAGAGSTFHFTWPKNEGR